MSKRHFLPITFALLSMMLPLSLFGQAKSKKEQRKEFQATVERLISLANAPLKSAPDIIASDLHAYSYCESILACSLEEFQQDTATINEWFREGEWVMDHQIILEPQDEKKFKNYDRNKLLEFYEYTGRLLWEARLRYSELKTYCNLMFQRRQEAQQRTMPTGNILSLFYEESGSSRPNTVLCQIERDTTSGAMILSGYVQHELVKTVIADSVLQRVRAMIEEYKIYQELTDYPTPPSFPEVPQKLGGPPSWSFRCELEGGIIHTASESRDISYGCSAICRYLTPMIEEKWKKDSQH